MADVKVFCVLFVLAGVVCGLPGKFKDDAPTWPPTYTVAGVLQLPYAEINEPFTGYYDATQKKSRVDYYGNMVLTIQRADMGNGYNLKVAPLSNYQVMNQRMCFNVSGVQSAPVTIQGMLPDLTNFKNVGQEQVAGQMCDVWKLVDVQGKKKDTYTMWVGKNNVPVKYEMMGFDSLLGSHYDKYVLQYNRYNTDAIPASTFEPPTGMTCGDFPGPGSSEHRVLMNPMMEYVHHHDDHIVEMFQKFKKDHTKEYKNEMEHSTKLHQFRQNVRYIHVKNRQGLSYTMGVNHLTDKSTKELKMLNGYRSTPGDNGAKVFDHNQMKGVSVPDSIDWRLYGAVTPVKDQGVCGSCWSFGTAETIEGAYFLKTGELVRLSQQQLMDCSWGEGNNACDGGEDFRSYNWIKRNGGLTSEEQYGPYLAQDSYCHSDKVKPVAILKDYVNVTMYDQAALKFAISFKGPVSIGIDASHKSLSFYANGVYFEPKCGSTPDDLDHAVLAVGYGVMNGQGYWLVKNSWSTHWGNDGYVLMSMKDNNCGVATSPTYVEL